VLTGYPGSGKTKLAQRLVSDREDFVRLNVDNLRSMYFGTTKPSKQEDLVYDTLVTIRDAVLRKGRSVVIDTTASFHRNAKCHTIAYSYGRRQKCTGRQKSKTRGNRRGRGLGQSMAKSIEEHARYEIQK